VEKVMVGRNQPFALLSEENWRMMPDYLIEFAPLQII
jgi:hypothetical protein